MSITFQGTVYINYLLCFIAWLSSLEHQLHEDRFLSGLSTLYLHNCHRQLRYIKYNIYNCKCSLNICLGMMVTWTEQGAREKLEWVGGDRVGLECLV